MIFFRKKFAVFLLLALYGMGLEAAPPPRQSAMDEFLELDAANDGGSRARRRMGLQPIWHFEFAIDTPQLYQFDNFEHWLVDDYQKGPHGFLVDFATYLPDYIRDILRFERDGKTYVRFFIHPEDTFYHKKVEAYLKARGIDYQSRQDFKAEQTSSRSVIIDGKFSLKTSTDQNNGRRETRVNPIFWAHYNRRLSDYYYQMKPFLKHLDIAWEAAAMGFPTTKIGNQLYGDLSQQVRLMEEVRLGHERHFSGFVLANHSKVKKLAERAGMTVEDFRSQAFYYLGRAQIELVMILGFNFTSAHGQNIRFGLTAEGQLSGKVILLDLTDGNPIREIFIANGQRDLVQSWDTFAERSNRSISDAYFVHFLDDAGYTQSFAKGARDALLELGGLPVSFVDQIYERGFLYKSQARFQLPDRFAKPYFVFLGCQNIFAR